MFFETAGFANHGMIRPRLWRSSSMALTFTAAILPTDAVFREEISTPASPDPRSASLASQLSLNYSCQRTQLAQLPTMYVHSFFSYTSRATFGCSGQCLSPCRKFPASQRGQLLTSNFRCISPSDAHPLAGSLLLNDTSLGRQPCQYSLFAIICWALLSLHRSSLKAND